MRRTAAVVLAVAVPLFAAPAGAADAPIGKVDAVLGNPTVKRGADEKPLAAGMDVFAGDVVHAPANSKARILLSGDSTLAIGAETRITLREMTVDKSGRFGRLSVAFGKFWMNVSKWSGLGASSIQIATPTAVAGVRGTTLWGDTKVDAICSLDGTVEVKNLVKPNQAASTLTAGNCSAELSKGNLTPLAPAAEAVQGYLKEVLIE